jgi:hypothetical protein
VAQQLEAKAIRLAFDRDCETNTEVAGKLIRCAEGYDAAGFDVAIETWPNDYKGIDDALVAGATIELLTGDDARAYLERLREMSPEKAAEAAIRGRAQVEISADEYLMNAAAVTALAHDESVFQRAGRLVNVISGAPVNDGLKRPDDAPRIVPIPNSIIREKLTRHAYFFRRVESQDGPINVQKPPPESCVRAVAERGQWEGIRPLAGTTDSPVMRRDGSILCAPGYDPATGLIFAPRGAEFPPVPERPTMDEVRAAIALLTDVVSDFPFERAAHRSSWLVCLLTPLARHAFDGPAPLFLADANTRGSGKTKILELVSVIATGRDFARVANSVDDNEWDKRILAAAIAGDPLVLIDNIGAELGCASLDAALTATSWKGRLLGKSEMAELPLSITWCASGNNVILAADTSRRVCPIRLASPLENPEERTGFHHPNLIRHVRQNRPALLCAALTILRGYHTAGRPDQGLPPWGSYEGWSDLVRQAIVWAGEPDPGETRQQLRAFADRGGSALRALIAAWPAIDPDGTGLTAAELCRRIESEPDSLRAARAALFDFCGGTRDGRLPSHVSVGKRLSRVRGRIVDGKSLDCQPTRDGTMLWFVRGMRGIAGDISTTFTRGVPYIHEKTSCMYGEIIRDGAENPPQPPASPASADWLDSVPLATVARPGELHHKSPSCKSCRGWRLIGGGLHCFVCWPPTDPLAVESRPELPAPQPAPAPVMDDDADLL